ncbi:MAG: hypothetical protein WCB04_03125 [Mycobacteriales bacterium]
MRQRRVLLGTIFYGGLLILMAAILTKVLGDVLPKTLARHIGFDSESYVMVLLFVPWIQFVRPRLVGKSVQWPVTLAVAAVCVVIGVLLYRSHLPSQVKTLNEAFIAGGMIAYLQLRRPLPAWIPIVISGAVLALVLLDSKNALVTDLAEGVVAIILLPLTVDVFDRRILDPEAAQSRPLRFGWYALMLALPIIFSVLNRVLDKGNPLHAVARYGVRPQEAFVAILLIGAYFAVLNRVRERAPA